MKLSQNPVLRIIVALFLGILCGIALPESGYYLNFFSDVFIRFLRMLIGPIIFCSIVIGIGQHHDLKKVGRIGLKALIYFEIITTFALIMAMVVANVVKPGEGLAKVVVSTVSNTTVAYTHHYNSVYQELLAMLPQSLLGPFVDGNLLHIVIISVLMGIAISLNGSKTRPVLQAITIFNQLLFKLLHIIILMAPIAVFGSMAYTVSKFGINTLISLAELILLVFASCFVFIFIVLSLVCRMVGLRLWEILYYIREEIFLTLGTSSSEIVLPQLMEKLVKKGCDKEIVALVLPTGYSFNLDGMSIYLGIAVVFLAQVYHIDLSLSQQAILMGFILLVSKGSAGVTGAGFITLTAIITSTNMLPVEGLGLLLTIDRFMSIARSLTNMIGNTIATFVIDRWESR